MLIKNGRTGCFFSFLLIFNVPEVVAKTTFSPQSHEVVAKTVVVSQCHRRNDSLTGKVKSSSRSSSGALLRNLSFGGKKL